MIQILKKNPLWPIFCEKKFNYVTGFFVFFFSLIAACLEGLSFSALLFGFTFLAKEMPNGKIFGLFLERFDPHTLFLASILFSIVFQLLRSLFSYLSHLMTSFISIYLQQKTQEKIYKQIFKFSYECVASYKMGDLIQYTGVPASFFPVFMDALNRVIVFSFMIVSYLIFMSFLSFPLTLIILSLFIATSFFQKKVLQKIGKASEQQSVHLVDLSKETAQNFEALKLIHIFQRQEKILKKIKSTLLQISASTFSLNKWNHLISPINEGVGILLAGASLILGFLFLKDGAFPLVSVLLTFLTLTYRLGTRFQLLLTSIGTLNYHKGSIARVTEILKNEDKIFYPNSTKNCPFFKKQIDFENVSFSYPSKNHSALKNITLRLEKGKTVAIVGKSGSGKSTFLDLLLRLYDPNKGTILFDGQSIHEFHLASWRNLFGVVPQDAFLFHDTIKENIRFGNLEARNEKVIGASKLAHAHDFISELPDGYQTVIGERGYRLSGGEKQRIALARALIRDPEILILDEATSHLDSHSELYIQKSLENLKGKKTLIIVAHRLSTLAFADEIYVFEKSVLIEKGTHQDLYNLGGRYRSLWNLQSKTKESLKEALI